MMILILSDWRMYLLKSNVTMDDQCVSGGLIIKRYAIKIEIPHLLLACYNSYGDKKVIKGERLLASTMKFVTIVDTIVVSLSSFVKIIIKLPFQVSLV